MTRPDFSSREFLESHVAAILGFYDRCAFDPDGGFFHCLRDDGSVYDRSHRHLVSSTRFVVNYAIAARRYPDQPRFADLARHAFAFLQRAHRQPDGHYAWELVDGSPTGDRAYAYGHAFVILACARAIQAGLAEARAVLDAVWAFLEERFWEEQAQAYRDDLSTETWQPSSYRGQNANMHMCEALIASYEATGEAHFLDRAETLADKFCRELPALTHGLVWEHYDEAWRPDFEYNIDRPNDLFRPWGFLPGHQAEWGRLILTLEGLRPRPWHLPTAEAFYREGFKRGWDTEFGGVVYGFAPDGTFCAPEKYYWVMSEGFATAWRLFARTGTSGYRDDYNALWDFSWRYLVDHEYGAWFRVVTRDGARIDDLKSPPGKTDYHTLGACWDVLDHWLPVESVR